MNIELKKKKEQRNYIIRQLIQVLLMSFSYVFISTVNTGSPLPVLLIPCAVCYAVRESPFNSALFGCVCGLLLDSASGTLTGFNAIILMWASLFISLLFHYVLRRHILNFLWLDLCVSSYSRCSIICFSIGYGDMTHRERYSGAFSFPRRYIPTFRA